MELAWDFYENYLNFVYFYELICTDLSDAWIMCCFYAILLSFSLSLSLFRCLANIEFDELNKNVRV